MIENSITEGTRLIVRDIQEEMETAFIDYSMSCLLYTSVLAHVQHHLRVHVSLAPGVHPGKFIVACQRRITHENLP